MTKGERITLEIRGDEMEYVFIGAGATVYAFRSEADWDNVLLLIPDLKFKDGTSLEDTAKDVLVKAYSASKNPYLPQIEYWGREVVTGHKELNRPCKMYKMPFYRDIKQADKHAWIEMKKLHKIRDVGMHEIYGIYEKATGKKPSLTFLGNKAAKVSCILAKDKLNINLVKALRALHDAFGDLDKSLTFEFNKTNVGIDNSGHLILRDCIYSSAITVHLKKDRKDASS